MKRKPLLIEEPAITIDRRSYEPAYAQLVNILRQQIATGTLAAWRSIALRVSTLQALPGQPDDGSPCDQHLG